MLVKLVRYDLRPTVRTASFFWAALIALSVYNHFTLNSLETAKYGDILAGGLSVIFFMIVLTVIAVLIVIMTITRFWKGLLGDEGYLMFTLPATTGQLVLSKGLSIMVLTLLNVMISLVSMAALLPKEALQQAASALRGIAIEHNIDGGQIILFACALLFMVCAFSLCNSMRLYAAMSAGQMAPRRKKLAAAAAYCLMNSLRRFLTGRLLINVPDFSEGLSTVLQRIAVNLGDLGAANVGMISAALVYLTAAALYFGICCWILGKRLNLE